MPHQTILNVNLNRHLCICRRKICFFYIWTFIIWYIRISQTSHEGMAPIVASIICWSNCPLNSNILWSIATSVELVGTNDLFPRKPVEIDRFPKRDFCFVIATQSSLNSTTRSFRYLNWALHKLTVSKLGIT